ncbi:ribosome maturation factor RimM [Trichocoleus sp. FACHB-262]|uniref:ribosome maturation factor RimM n=1 Tax=Trichocoleus sp. FACHB-262 TaxID=2692869 RepID=UPI001683E215|nr:ribosome maturation factor RimM [Trichocoleus sp. FACHB-262]MBD2122921.1 ribosome maturation factor RimM [Trichocoleus sp. FACHB-262]
MIRENPMSESRKTNPSRTNTTPPSLATAPEGWLQIGKIVAAQGLKGEVRVYPDSDFPERFEQPGTRWLLPTDTTDPQPIELIKGRYLHGKNMYILQLAGISDRDQAEALKGCKLLVPESDRPQLEEGEFHVIDLIGLDVFDQATQALLGTVTDVIPAGNDLLEVKLAAPSNPKQPTVLVPFVKEIVPVVDLAARRVELTPPVGLIE